MFHCQQDNLGCVDDEANIVNKCDARRQVVPGNEMFSLSKEWERSISVLTAVYGAIVLFWHESQAMYIFKSKLAYLVRQVESSKQCQANSSRQEDKMTRSFSIKKKG